MDALMRLQSSPVDWSIYLETRCFRFVRDLGLRMQSGQLDQLYLPLHVHGNHWTLFCIDRARQVIRYGDSFGSPCPNSKLEAVRFWLSFHNLGVFDVGEDLIIARQPQGDAISCGIIVINSIKAQLFDEPLWTPSQASLLRIREFLSIVAVHSTALADWKELKDCFGGDNAIVKDTVAESEWKQHSRKRKNHDTEVVSTEDPATRTAIDDMHNCGKKKKIAQGCSAQSAGDGTLASMGFFIVNPSSKFLEASRERDRESLQENARTSEQMRQRLDAEKQDNLRRQNRERKQRERERKRAAQIATGERDANGRLKKEMSLKAEVALTRIGPSTAELSRPYRGFKEDVRKRNPRKRERKPKNEVAAKTDAKAVFWYAPLIWRQIAAAAAAVGWSPRAIKNRLQSVNLEDFMGISEQVIGRMIDRKGSEPKWKDSVLRKVTMAKVPRGNVTRSSILGPYPEAFRELKELLISLRQTGIPVVALVARGVMAGFMQARCPAVFAVKTNTGVFTCSLPYVRKFLRVNLRWSLRKATRAARKIPVNAVALCRASFCRQVISTRDYRVPPELRINIDQAQVLLLEIGNRTYEQMGSSQVSVLGHEEKRAFTLLVGVSACGEVLPFQAIWKGKTAASLPSSTARMRAEADQLGFRFESSKTDTYWSTFETMCSYIDHILTPYLDRKKRELGLSHDHMAILQLDVWSIHRSEQFSTWIQEHHPRLIRDYVPPGCTPIWQPCDATINRVVKITIRQSQHEDIMSETLTQLNAGVAPAEVKLDLTLGVLRDRSVKWLVDAYHAVNDQTLVKKARLYYHAKSLTSDEAQQLLWNIEEQEPELWTELTQRRRREASTGGELAEPEFSEGLGEGEGDFDTSIPLDVVKNHILHGSAGLPHGYVQTKDGSLTRRVDESSLEADSDTDEEGTASDTTGWDSESDVSSDEDH
ncbi:hypothetical protein EIP86_009644 [Pleurotus ostreatoroseus]|nr:hypothetical protein EIP86_009644 [Pleurotus ostreatoroseus]